MITDYGLGTCMFAVFGDGYFQSVSDIDDGEDDDEQREDHTEADADPSRAAQTCVCKKHMYNEMLTIRSNQKM